MAVVVVTVTQSATATAATGSSSSSSLSPLTTAGIIIGCLLGGVLLVLILYLLKRYRGHKFTRVANPTHDDAVDADVPGISSRRSKRLSRHSHKPSITSEPLIAPTFLPPLPFASRAWSDTPPRLDAISPISAVTGGSPRSSFDMGEISQVTASGTISRAIMLDPQPSSISSRLSIVSSPPHARQTSDDSAPSTPTNSPLFLHRALKSRAQASEEVSPPRHPSPDVSQSRSTTVDSAEVRADEERLLAEAERTAVRDAETAQKKEDEDEDEDEDWDDCESIYSQASASVDHSRFLDPASRQNSVSSSARRKSSRRRRMPAPTAELSPVVEMPDTPVSRSASHGVNLSLDPEVSHRTASPPRTLEQSGVTFPLLASVNFGNDSASSGTRRASVSSTSALGTSSSGRISRYPSLAMSSIGQSSHSRTQSDAERDQWRHPPPGLAGLTWLEIGEPLQNPHSPVEERPTTRHPDVLTPAKRARLRKGTSGSTPEVERRVVMQGGIAHIDVAL